MASIHEIKRQVQEDGSINVMFTAEAYFLKAAFTINENDDGWEITDIYLKEGDKYEAEEIISDFMQDRSTKYFNN